MKIKTIGRDREQHHKQRRENAYSLSYARREICEYARKTPDTAPHARKPNGRLWKRIADQVERNSLEWIHWEKFLSICEFISEKNNGTDDQILAIEDGELKTVNEFDYYYSSDQNALKLGRTPLFLENIENRRNYFCLGRGVSYRGLQKLARLSI